jgi:hypothetical protein
VRTRVDGPNGELMAPEAVQQTKEAGGIQGGNFVEHIPPAKKALTRRRCEQVDHVLHLAWLLAVAELEGSVEGGSAQPFLVAALQVFETEKGGMSGHFRYGSLGAMKVARLSSLGAVAEENHREAGGNEWGRPGWIWVFWRHVSL